MKIETTFPVRGGEIALARISPEYHDAMHEILNACAANKDYIARQEAIEGERKEKILQEVAEWDMKGNTIGFVAILRGVVVGYALINRTDDPNTGNVGVIAILPKQRGLSISHGLLRATIAEAQKVLGVTRITLQTFKDNEVAQALYVKHGFVIDEENKQKDAPYYGKMLPRLQMVKNLDEPLR